MTLRDTVFQALANDTQIKALLGAGAVFPNYSIASPANALNRWITLRWGAADAALGRDATARPIPLTLAAYDREPNYLTVDRLLVRSRAILRSLEARSTGDGWVIDVGPPQSSSDDSWDDTYSAVWRSDTYRIVASGGM